MSDVENAIDALKAGDATGFRTATNKALYDRVSDALLAKKVEIAQNIFADPADEEELEGMDDADSEAAA
jgi:hypothetical protein